MVQLLGLFSDIIDQYVFLYFDNILVHSKTINNHEKHLHEVFSLLHAHKLQAKCKDPYEE